MISLLMSALLKLRHRTVQRLARLARIYHRNRALTHAMFCTAGLEQVHLSESKHSRNHDRFYSATCFLTTLGSPSRNTDRVLLVSLKRSCLHITYTS